MQKKIAIFGSTGSIGTNSLEIIRKNPYEFKVEILVAYTNAALLAKQALEFLPNYVCIVDESKLPELKELLSEQQIEILHGLAGLNEIAQRKTDLSIMAIVGSDAIMPTINSIKAGNNIALANKECLVCAGQLIMNLALKYKVQIIPVDSEHNGLFQIFEQSKLQFIKDVTITASGGPFRNHSLKQMHFVKKEDALKHPNWTMGPKITIDSATLVNKCLEIIEAYYLFPLHTNQLKIIIHPESIVHAMISYTDGSTVAQMSKPSMQIPIANALYYPKRTVLDEFNNFEFTNLSFLKPDKNKFPSLRILDDILSSIITNSSLIFNIANEIAVNSFLNDKISFLQITQVIEEMLHQIPQKQVDNFDDIIEQINLTKDKATKYITCLL